MQTQEPTFASILRSQSFWAYCRKICFCNLCHSNEYLTKKVTWKYSSLVWRFKDVLRKKNVDILLEYWSYDCTIELQEGIQILFGPICNFLQIELVVLLEYNDENLTRNFVQHAKSLIGAPNWFIKKNIGLLGMYVDYHGLNKIT